jgi:hypothetical protein
MKSLASNVTSGRKISKPSRTSQNFNAGFMVGNAGFMVSGVFDKTVRGERFDKIA